MAPPRHGALQTRSGRPPDLLTPLMMVVGEVGGGGAFVIGRIAVASTPPATLATYRYILAIVLFAILIPVSGAEWTRPTASDALRIAGMGLAVVAGYNLLFLQGLRLAPASDGGLIVPGSAPAFSVALSWLLLRERPSWRAVAGSAVAAAGILVIFAAAGGFGNSLAARRQGDLLYIAAGSMWGLFNILARGLGSRITPVLANAYAAAVGLVVIAVLAVITERYAILTLPAPQAGLEAGYLAVFTVLLLWATVRGVARLGVARVAAFAYVAPVAAVVGSIAFLGERVSLVVLLGGAVALAGTWVATTSTKLPCPLRRQAA